MRRRNITPEHYAELFNKQQGKCAICAKSYKIEPQMFAVDHDHTTNEIRGLLCRKCNLAIGLFNESPELLLKAVQYLNNH